MRTRGNAFPCALSVQTLTIVTVKKSTTHATLQKSGKMQNGVTAADEDEGVAEILSGHGIR